MKTKRKHAVALSGLVAGLLSASLTYAQASVRTDPGVHRQLHTGISSPWTARWLPPTPGVASMLVQLAAPATPSSLASIAATGATIRVAGGRPLTVHHFVLVTADASALSKLETMPGVVRVLSAPAKGPPPIDLSGELLGLEAARGSRPALDLLTGKGVLVADLDTNADVFHPQFFFADAGYYDWIDVDGDNVFSPGKDAIDLDRDGTAGSKELASLLRAETHDRYGKLAPKARSADFDPAIDWLYLDEDGDGKRDYGAAAGFDDAVPAMGEPLFVPDDLDRSGKLDRGERVVRLGTSKFRKVYVKIEHYAEVDQVFERGKDLSTHKNDYTGDLLGYSDAAHASGVLSIVAGDVPLAGRRWVGIAPEAELLLAWEIVQDEGGALTWALGEKPHAMLHETAVSIGSAVDGSDSYAALLDTSTAQDKVAHTCPMGNTGGAKKHAHVVVEPAAVMQVPIHNPEPLYQPAPTYISISMNVREAPGVGIMLKEPGGAQVNLTEGSLYGYLSTGGYYYITRTTTSRGTFYVEVILYTDDPAAKPVPIGDYQLQLTGHASAKAVFDGYLMDEVSGWGLGTAWDDAFATDDSTVGIPATADSCIAVGAHVLHEGGSTEPWFSAGGPVEDMLTLRGYSGRGPRIDGVLKPDVAAPDNPWSAAPVGKAYSSYSTRHGSMRPMGGTSGATPHATGVTALLAQAGIHGLGARDAIRTGAIVDSVTGPVPNKLFGHGRLSAAGALGADDKGGRPTLTLSLSPSQAKPSSPITITPTVTDPDAPSSTLQLKWDDDYDGTWDTEYEPVAPRSVTRPQAGTFPYKARVRDAQGRFAEAVAWLTFEVPALPEAGTDAPPESGPAVDAQGDVTVGQPAIASPAESDGGCGCRTADRDTPRTWASLAPLLALLLLGRRRRAPCPLSTGAAPSTMPA